MSDIVLLPPPPHREPIQIHDAMTRVGFPYVAVDPRKVVGIVEHSEPDDVAPFDPPTQAHNRIAQFVIEFLLNEMRAGRIPAEFLPLQSGVGNVANAVLAGLGENPEIPPFTMFTEVFQDSCVELMERRRLVAASSTALTITEGQAPAHLRAHGLLRAAHRPAPAGADEPPRHHPAPRRHHDEHGARGGHLRPRELDARARHADDERHRRQRRLHAQRLPVDLHVPVHEQGRARCPPSCRWSRTWTTTSTRCRSW